MHKPLGTNAMWFAKVQGKSYKKRNNMATRNNRLFNGTRNNGACKKLSKGEIQAYEARLNN